MGGLFSRHRGSTFLFISLTGLIMYAKVIKKLFTCQDIFLKIYFLRNKYWVWLQFHVVIQEIIFLNYIPSSLDGSQNTLSKFCTWLSSTITPSASSSSCILPGFPK